MSKTPKDYLSGLKPIWCPGCGDFGVMTALAQAFATLDIPNENIAVVSGIGCSSRLPGYMKSYGFNSIHGRAIPISTGLKLARPDITVVTVGGDGDGFAIGGGHLPHAARRNVDINYFVMNNNIYGLTKGQTSPTTPVGIKTNSSFYGSMEAPIKPCITMLAYEAGFVARGFSGDIKHLANLFVEAIRHPGFSFVEVLSPCVTYQGTEQFQIIRQAAEYLTEDKINMTISEWDEMNKGNRIPLGIIRKVARERFEDYAKKLQTNWEHKFKERNQPYSITESVDSFLP